MNIIDFKQAKEWVKRKKIVQIGKVFEIDNHKVTVQSRTGVQYLTCTCLNFSKTSGEGLCKHKKAVLLFLADENFYGRIDKLIEFYKKHKEINGLNYSIDNYINDLENIRRIK